MNLLLDIKVVIASFDEEVWFKLFLVDDEFKEYTKRSVVYFRQLFTRKVTFDDRIEYHLLNQKHREDGPAVIMLNGSQYWHKEGLIHREYGPAVIYANGTKFWYKNGKLHRENGPAIIWPNGTLEWYKNGEKYNE